MPTEILRLPKSTLYNAVLVGFIISFFTSAYGASTEHATITLSQAVAEFEASPRIKKAKSEVEEASWKRVEATSPFLPTLTASAQYLVAHQYVFTNVSLPGSGALVIPNIIPTSIYGLNAQWILFDGFANVNRYQGAKSLEGAQVKELDWTRFSGQREVILMYYRALAARILENVAEQNVKTLEDHLHEVKLFKQNGITTKFDVLRVDVQSSEANSDLLSTKDNVDVSVLRLGEVLGHGRDTREPVGELPILKTDLIKSIPSLANENANVQERADVQAMQKRVEGLDKYARAADKHWIPTVGLGGSYTRYNNINDSATDWSSYRDAYTLGVQLSWNLFDGFSSSARDHEAIERETQAQESLEMTRIHARNDVEYWRRRYLYFCNVYQSRLGDVEKSTESVRLAREGRRVGIRTTTDTLDAELELFRARAGIVNAQIGSIEALINLELATGTQLYTYN